MPRWGAVFSSSRRASNASLEPTASPKRIASSTLWSVVSPTATNCTKSLAACRSSRPRRSILPEISLMAIQPARAVKTSTSTNQIGESGSRPSEVMAAVAVRVANSMMPADVSTRVTTSAGDKPRTWRPIPKCRTVQRPGAPAANESVHLALRGRKAEVARPEPYMRCRAAASDRGARCSECTTHHNPPATRRPANAPVSKGFISSPLPSRRCGSALESRIGTANAATARTPSTCRAAATARPDQQLCRTV